jgi:hypothetical protein
MASALRVTLTLREARALRQLAAAGIYALNFRAPEQADELTAMLDIGIHDLAQKQAEARSRRKAATARPDLRPMINLDYYVWAEVTPEREGGQNEIRRNAWRIYVLNPDQHGPMHLANGCTATDCKGEVKTLARNLVSNIRKRLAA